MSKNEMQKDELSLFDAVDRHFEIAGKFVPFYIYAIWALISFSLMYTSDEMSFMVFMACLFAGVVPTILGTPLWIILMFTLMISHIVLFSLYRGVKYVYKHFFACDKN